MRALLDVNVLVALLDRQHAGHRVAHQWLAKHLEDGWASCPLTENGCVRVISNPRYSASVAIAEVLEKLGKAKTSGHHAFWPDDFSLTDPVHIERRHLRGHQQVTDVYLVALARKRTAPIKPVRFYPQIFS